MGDAPTTVLLWIKHISFANPESMKLKTNFLEAWKLGMFANFHNTLKSISDGRKTNWLNSKVILFFSLYGQYIEIYYWLLNIHYRLLNIHLVFWMLIITVKNSNFFFCLVPVLPLLFSNKIVFLQNIKHGLCLRPGIPATGEMEAGGFQTEGVPELHKQFMSSLGSLMRPSLKIQSKNNVEDVTQHVKGPGLIEREGGS